MIMVDCTKRKKRIMDYGEDHLGFAWLTSFVMFAVHLVYLFQIHQTPHTIFGTVRLSSKYYVCV